MQSGISIPIKMSPIKGLFFTKDLFLQVVHTEITGLPFLLPDPIS